VAELGSDILFLQPLVYHIGPSVNYHDRVALFLQVNNILDGGIPGIEQGTPEFNDDCFIIQFVFQLVLLSPRA
jgi:uncharacterized membrane-anchored protein YitT (DUF2179 family)